MAAQPRGGSRPSFASSPCPRLKEGAGKTGSRLAPMDRHARCRLRVLHASRRTGQPGHPGLPCAVVGTAYVVLSPGSDALLPPSPCGWLMPRTRSGRDLTARLGAQTPGARTTRFGRTRITPVIGAPLSLTVSRPAKRFAPTSPTSTAARSAFETIAIRPSSLGRSEEDLTKIRIRIKRIILVPTR